MTAQTYQARILGKTALVTVPVRVEWIFTANDIEATSEILRRFVLVPLNRAVPEPMNYVPKKGWRHPNLMDWVTSNRPNLIWACLTLIQNWVANGKVKQATPMLASYEGWAGVMGGILGAAGFNGFLEGQDEERAKAVDSTQDGLAQLVNVLGQYPSRTVFRPGGNRLFKGKPTISMMDVLNGSERPKVLEKGKPIDWGVQDPIQINGWGYNAYDGGYTASSRIGRALKVFARKPYQLDGMVMTFEELPDKRGGVSVYRMTKKKG